MDTRRIQLKSGWVVYCRTMKLLLALIAVLAPLTKRIFNKLRMELADWYRYYLIWEEICRGWVAARNISPNIKTKWIFAVLTAVLFLPASYFIYMEEQGNFHPITPGEAYRSAQLDRDELQHYIRKFNIKSIINLRGKRTGHSWYREELDTCRQSGCRHYDLSIPADESPSPAKIKELLRLFENAPRPVLFHCRAGADRTGLAAALWKVTVDGKPKALARRQLSMRFGHFPIGPTAALDDFFKKWQPGRI